MHNKAWGVWYHGAWFPRLGEGEEGVVGVQEDGHIRGKPLHLCTVMEHRRASVLGSSRWQTERGRGRHGVCVCGGGVTYFSLFLSLLATVRVHALP